MTARLGNIKKPIMASWLRDIGCRLDARPFVSGALEARKALENLSVRKDVLSSLTVGYNGGIYNGPQFSRTYVDSVEHGVPFVGSSAMLASDLSNLPLLRKQDALSPKLRHLELKPGMTMISCSGTIGRTVYARSDMAGMWSSQHIMKVVPDVSKIPSGYLFAFISCKYGIPIVVSGTYGSIIQSIGPQHISTLPVPRFADKLEQKVHVLVEAAANHRAEAAFWRRKAISAVEKALDWHFPAAHASHAIVNAGLLVRRMDGHHHSPVIQHARRALGKHTDSSRISTRVESVFEPNRGARRKVEDEACGVPFLSSSTVFELEPRHEYLISRRTPQLDKLLLTSRDLLLPRSGQIGGVIGRAVLPLNAYFGNAASEHLVRIRCRSKEDSFYLWAILASQPGYFATIGTAFGTSIPSLDCSLLSELKVPWICGHFRAELVEYASKVTDLLSQAIVEETLAITLVEDAVEGDA